MLIVLLLISTLVIGSLAFHMRREGKQPGSIFWFTLSF